MPVRLPNLLTPVALAPEAPQRNTNAQFHQGFQRLAAWANTLAKAIQAIERRLGLLEQGSTSAAPATPASWFEITSAVAITVDPADGDRQYLVTGHNTTLSKASYTGTTTLTLRIEHGATPYLVNWDAAWACPAPAVVEFEPNTYSLYVWELDGGRPFLRSHLTGLPLPPP